MFLILLLLKEFVPSGFLELGLLRLDDRDMFRPIVLLRFLFFLLDDSFTSVIFPINSHFLTLTLHFLMLLILLLYSDFGLLLDLSLLLLDLLLLTHRVLHPLCVLHLLAEPRFLLNGLIEVF